MPGAQLQQVDMPLRKTCTEVQRKGTELAKATPSPEHHRPNAAALSLLNASHIGKLNSRWQLSALVVTARVIPV